MSAWELEIELAEDRPLGEQIAAAIRRAVIDGKLQPGDALPPGRAMAAALGVNLETVQRAYRELAAEGLVVSRVGRGSRISEQAEPDRLDLQQRVADLVAAAARLGMTQAEVAGLVLGNPPPAR